MEAVICYLGLISSRIHNYTTTAFHAASLQIAANGDERCGLGVIYPKVESNTVAAPPLLSAGLIFCPFLKQTHEAKIFAHFKTKPVIWRANETTLQAIN